MDAKLAELKERLGAVHDLRRVYELMYWDQTVWMPPGGAQVRTEQLTTLDRLAHELFIGDEVGRLLEELRPLEESLDHDSDDASLLRVVRRDWEKARRVPPELSAEITRVASDAQEAWVAARANDDYASFRPWLDRTIELKHRYLECFDPAEDPYDILLDDYEPGMKTAEVRAVFDELKRDLVPFIQEVASSDGEDGFMRGPFDEAGQEAMSLEIIRRFGYDERSWRLDRTVHPYAATSGTQDIRLTTRYKSDDLSSLFTAMHECGHGLYEHGVSRTLERTPLCHGVSSALHESQSRLWENVVGRSIEFWRFFYPRLQETFPQQLASVPLEAFHRAINRVKPSYIRVDADEATYNLHIVLRFELEQELLAGTLSTADLADEWKDRFERYLGIPVPSDTLGVLQDVHWSGGSFGYFPTYSLGNIVSVQIWEKLVEELPELPERFERGEFGELHEWLRERLYSLGRKHTPQETLERVVGTPTIDPAPYMRYLRAKLGALFGAAA